MPSLTYQEIYELLTTIRDERRTHANTATRVGEAMLALLAYMADAPYLRKDQADATNYLLSLLAGAVVGESGQIRLNPDGSITCARIHVNGSAIFDELVFNRQSVNEGDQLYSNRGIIEKVDYLGNGQYRLTFRKEYAEETTTFKVNDCLKSKVNELVKNGTYFTSWYRVLSMDYDANTADVILYPDEEVPGGKNFAPVEGAVAARWGNAVDKERQQLFYLSATDGTFCFLQGVTKPIINDAGTNTAAFIGLPADIPALNELVAAGTLQRDRTVVYAQTLIAEKIITMKHDGTPEYQQREWDDWDPERQYIMGYDEEEERYVQDNCWYGGSLWRCIVPKARVGVEPSLTNTDWACLRSAGLTLDIESSEGDWFNGERSWATLLVAMVVHGDLVISADDITTIVWTRETGDDAADEAWNVNQAKKVQAMQLAVTYDLEHPELSDIPAPWTFGSRCGFRCTVIVADRTVSNSYGIT